MICFENQGFHNILYSPRILLSQWRYERKKVIESERNTSTVEHSLNDAFEQALYLNKNELFGIVHFTINQIEDQIASFFSNQEKLLRFDHDQQHF